MPMIAGSALAGTGLAGALYADLTAEPWFNATPEGQAFCDRIAAAIVAYIVASATVVPTALLAPPGTAGGPVTGTATVT